jgi:hypothetical protein
MRSNPQYEIFAELETVTLIFLPVKLAQIQHEFHKTAKKVNTGKLGQMKQLFGPQICTADIDTEDLWA